MVYIVLLLHTAGWASSHIHCISLSYTMDLLYITYHAPCIQSCTFGLYSYELCDVPMYTRKYKSSWYAVCFVGSMSVYSAKYSLTLANTSSDGTLLKIGSDDYTHSWCELLTTVSTPIYSVMFTPTMQYTRYHLCEQFEVRAS